MLILKQSVSIDIRMGPFVDALDGVTPETGVTLAGADQAEVLKANGAATVAMAGTFAAVTGADGWYDYTVAVGDVDTVGEVVFVVQDLSLCLPVHTRCYVLEETIYDALFGAASAGFDANGRVDVGSWLGTAVTLGAGAPDVNVQSMDAASIAGGVIAAAELTNIENEIWDALKSAHVTPNSFGDFLDIEVSGRAIAGDAMALTAAAVDAIWDELQSGHVTAGTFGRFLDAQVANVETDTQDIQSRLPAALISGRMDASVGAMAANVLTAAAINAAALTAAKFAAGAVDANALATDAVNEIRDAVLPTQNATFDNIYFLFVAASDHVTPVTGATGLAVTRSIDGGAFGAGTGAVAEVANGIYQYDASAADMNGGVITFRFTASGGTPGAPDDRFITIVTGGGV